MPIESMYSSRALASWAARGTSANVRGADGNGSGQPATAVWPTVSSDCASPIFQTSQPIFSSCTIVGARSRNFAGRRAVHTSGGSVTCVSQSITQSRRDRGGGGHGDPPTRRGAAPHSIRSDLHAARQILVTNALPYVNADLHLGHLVEHIQTDIWVRFQRMRGTRCASFCGDDTHGTATMIRAQQEGREPEALLEEVRARPRARPRRLRHPLRPLRQHAQPVEPAARERGVGGAARGRHVVEREVTQLYDAKAGIFLADRFVKGKCPRCGSPDQYGDNCEVCGAVYGPEDLINPVSTITGTRPELRSATHYFVVLERFHEFLAEWTRRPAGCRARRPTGSRTASSPSRCATGTCRGRRPTSASRSPTRRATTSTSGSTRRSAT